MNSHPTLHPGLPNSTNCKGGMGVQTPTMSAIKCPIMPEETGPNPVPNRLFPMPIAGCRCTAQDHTPVAASWARNPRCSVRQGSGRILEGNNSRELCRRPDHYRSAIQESCLKLLQSLLPAQNLHPIANSMTHRQMPPRVSHRIKYNPPRRSPAPLDL